MTLNVAVLTSHQGSNLRALRATSNQESSGFKIVLAICNNAGAAALAFAKDTEIPALHLSRRTHPNPGALDAAMCSALEDADVGLVVTAGYLRKLEARTLARFDGKIINVHPAPLPEFGGQGMFGSAVHEAILASGVRVSGPTIHVVNAEYDAGPVIAHADVPVLADDTVDSLSARVLEMEHRLLPAVVGRIAAGEPFSLEAPWSLQEETVHGARSR
ncbi:Phosphoribosylglycinamide formyltransferase [Frankia canadensis]|uniref:Phosphoribosylglycinamide formyltransferase n=1 Tax=Frankia canadensis TaxID=1836972 RepID=A0A2I2KVR2_9ACTN|nr:phosphoribosylglycinamide formyltransferase [Frankia canadensis]SNQ49736.1 Phosphoribosylglycinamide formyltransferase [Frankia canadensis]SOU57026.1 Phosphoribosylglycinamide formyltransferase [Frankia canadensis]